MLSQHRKKRDRRLPASTHWWQGHGDTAIKLLLLLTTAGVISALFPTNKFHEYANFREGTIAPEEIIAPLTFSVNKRLEDYGREAQAARAAVLPIVRMDAQISKTKLADFESFLIKLRTLPSQSHADTTIQTLKQGYPGLGSLSESTFRELLNSSHFAPRALQITSATSREILEQAYRNGILLQNKASLNSREMTRVLDGVREKVSMDSVMDRETFTQDLQDVIKLKWPSASAEKVKTVYELVLAYLAPNLTYEESETELARQEAQNNISRIKGTVLKGERIVDSHDRISGDHMDKLNSLAQFINNRQQQDPLITYI